MAHEMLQYATPLLRNPWRLVIDKRTDRAPNGTIGTAVGDSKPGINPSRLEIRMKNVRVIRNGVYRSAVMSDDLLALASTNPWAPSKTCCSPPGLSTERLAANKDEYQNQKQEYQQLHGHGICDGRLRKFGMNVERLQLSRHRAGEKVVQYLGKPQLFRHNLSFSLLAL